MRGQRLYFADGVYARLSSDEEPSLVRSATGFGRASLGAEDRDLILGLLHGLPARAADEARVGRLLRHGLAALRSSADDPTLAAKLDQLSAGWSWQRPARGASSQRFARLYRLMLRAHARRKVFLDAFGQTPCLPETAVRRALLAGSEPRRVLCIGDDDLVSVALAALGHEVVVLDIDDTILIPFLTALAKEWQLPLRALRCDLNDPLPPRLRGRFDLLYTDPLSTRGCLELFLSRGMAGLSAGGRICCCVHPAALQLFSEVADELGLDLHAHHGDFNHYYDDAFQEDLYRSDLVELSMGKGARPRFSAAESARVDIFAGELYQRQHASGDVRSPDLRGAGLERIRAVLMALEQSPGLGLSAVRQVQSDGALCTLALLEGGGYLGITADPADGRLAVDVYPAAEERDEVILELLLEALPRNVCAVRQRVPRPLVDVLASETEDR